MAIWFLRPTKSSDPAGGCRPCTNSQGSLCPGPIALTVGCGDCFQVVKFGYRYLGNLVCWPGSGHCNPNACCPYMSFDPWVDFRNGLWVSSTVIPIYVDCSSGGPQATTLQINPFASVVSKPITTGSSPVCGGTQVATLTVFDDGSIALA